MSTNSARIWDAETGVLVAELKQPGAIALGKLSSTNGEPVAIVDEDRAAIWDAETGASITVLKGHRRRVNCITFSPDGKLVATASDDATARIRDAATGAVITELRGHEGQVESIAFSADGRHVVTASLDSTARIWDAAVGRQIAVLKGHEAAVGGASFSPDGRRIMTEASDSTIRIWDAATAGQVAVLEAESGVALAFGPNAKSVVKMGLLDRGTHPIRVWRVFSNTQDLVDDTKNVVPRCLTREQREGAFLDPTPPAWCIEMKKWPYQTQEWKDWLRYTRTNDSPPLPDTPTWSSWVAAREAK